MGAESLSDMTCGKFLSAVVKNLGGAMDAQELETLQAQMQPIETQRLQGPRAQTQQMEASEPKNHEVERRVVGVCGAGARQAEPPEAAVPEMEAPEVEEAEAYEVEAHAVEAQEAEKHEADARAAGASEIEARAEEEHADDAQAWEAQLDENSLEEDETQLAAIRELMRRAFSRHGIWRSIDLGAAAASAQEASRGAPRREAPQAAGTSGRGGEKNWRCAKGAGDLGISRAAAGVTFLSAKSVVPFFTAKSSSPVSGVRWIPQSRNAGRHRGTPPEFPHSRDPGSNCGTENRTCW